MKLSNLRKIQNEIRKKSKEHGLTFKAKTKSSFAYSSGYGTKNTMLFEFVDEGFGTISVGRGFLKCTYNTKKKHDIIPALIVEYAERIAVTNGLHTVLLQLDEITDECYETLGYLSVDSLSIEDKSDLETHYIKYYKNFDNGVQMTYSNEFWKAVNTYQKKQNMFQFDVIYALGETINHEFDKEFSTLETCSYRNHYYDSSLTLFAEGENVFVEDKITGIKKMVGSPEELPGLIEEIFDTGLSEQRLANLLNPELKYLNQRVFYNNENTALFDAVREYLLEECGIEAEEIEFAAKHNYFIHVTGRMATFSPFVMILHIANQTIVVNLNYLKEGRKALESFGTIKEGLMNFLHLYSEGMDKLDIKERRKYQQFVDDKEREFKNKLLDFTWLKDGLIENNA